MKYLVIIIMAVMLFSSPASAWEFSQSTDSMTDMTTISASVTSKPYKTDETEALDVLLGVKCQEGRLSITFMTSEFISNSPKLIRYRFDKEDPKTKKWNVTPNFKGQHSTGWVDAAYFITMAEESNKLILQFQPYGELLREVEFDVSGDKDKLGAIVQACPWNDDIQPAFD